MTIKKKLRLTVVISSNNLAVGAPGARWAHAPTVSAQVTAVPTGIIRHLALLQPLVCVLNVRTGLNWLEWFVLFWVRRVALI